MKKNMVRFFGLFMFLRTPLPSSHVQSTFWFGWNVWLHGAVRCRQVLTLSLAEFPCLGASGAGILSGWGTANAVGGWGGGDSGRPHDTYLLT